MITQASPQATRLDNSVERELVDRARTGDLEAFGVLYNDNHAAVFRFVYYRVGKDEALAEDIASETFVRALRNIARFTWQGGGFTAWVITISRNLIADHFKVKRTKVEVVHDDMTDIEIALAECVADVADAYVVTARARVVRTAVQSLIPRQRECIYYRFFRDFTVDETAAAMKLTQGAVKTLQYRAIRAMGHTLRRSLEAVA
ncbi:sigma-70 family RNA polymerase sigma factor [Streptomyces sp. NPDC046977]|uniref:sigma-70 family RNA polymerase sigma factor n=1 Tax=Streptomyces sp. NPDC046977 TaxID=3154703 RepID=UPI0033C056F1